MRDQEKIIQRIDDLIQKGNQVLSTSYIPQGIISMSSPCVDKQAMANFRTSSLLFLSQIAGENSEPYKEFKEQCSADYASDVKKGLGILEAFKDAVENGYLQKFEDIVAAGIFSDFIEMADHLLDNKYHHPAASLLGAVLEDSLRKICKKHDINIGKESNCNLSKLNKLLCDNNIYNRIIFKQIDTWKEIRNQVNHGRFDEIKDKIKLEDVKEMSKGIQRFLSEYL